MHVDIKKSLAKLKREADCLTPVQPQFEAAKARENELLAICQAVQRDLLLRAEPDFDDPNVQVVNLSAGFWEELNRVIGQYDDTACKSFDAMISRKQAEAVEAAADKFGSVGTSPFRHDLMLTLKDYAQRLRQQANEQEQPQ